MNNNILLLVAISLGALSSILRLVLLLTEPKETQKKVSFRALQRARRRHSRLA
jgi:hypothetical protein